MASLPPQIEHCSIRLYLSNQNAEALYVSGVYVPPSGSGGLKRRRFEDLCCEIHKESGSPALSHLIAGDFNITNWDQQYHEWLHESHIAELINPDAPTFATGSALDKFLFQTRGFVPASLLPSQPTQAVNEMKDPQPAFYPGEVVDYTHISDHLPIIIPLTWGMPPQQPPLRRFRLKDLSDEDWSERNKHVETILARMLPKTFQEQQTCNPTRIHQAINAAITKAFKDEYRQAKPPKPADPLEAFLRSNIEHPDMPYLLTALKWGDQLHIDKAMRSINAANWKSYLASANKADTRGIFAYLARSEGRKQKGLTKYDLYPMHHPDGYKVTDPRAKAHLITEAFRKRFTTIISDAIPSPPTSDEAIPRTHAHLLNPLQPYRKQMQGHPTPIRYVELLRAIQEQSLNKAPGIDNITTELYRRLPSTYPFLVMLYNHMLAGGQIPPLLRLIQVVPIPKPGRDPGDPTSRRPISLICTCMKILEQIIYNRIIHHVESRLFGGQHAYRRNYSTEHHLTTLMDHAHRSLICDQFVYIISYDIESAFDRVPHAQLLRAVEAFDIEPYTCRLVHNWLRGRHFQISYTSPHGQYRGQRVQITTGLPQGGVLSPILWLMYFNYVHDRLDEERLRHLGTTANFLDLFFADDMTIMITAPSLPDLCSLAHFSDESVHNTMSLGSLRIQRQKTQNVLLDPRIINDGLFRRTDNTAPQPTTTRVRDQYCREARWTVDTTDFDPDQETPPEPRPRGLDRAFPYPLSSTMKVLGITIDRHFTFDSHHSALLAKSRTRQGILSSVAHRGWGLETSILRITHDALVTSLLRYGLNILGSSMPDDLVNRIDVLVINPAARRITGLETHTRIEVLHFLAGTQSYRNLYICHTAQFLHSSLLVPEGQIQARLKGELNAMLHTTTYHLVKRHAAYDKMDAFLLGPENFPPEMLDLIEWSIMDYIDRPQLTDIPNLTSMYVAHATEITRAPLHREHTFRFKGVTSWQETAVKVLKYVGWRPECAVPQVLNVGRLLPTDQATKRFKVYEETPCMSDYRQIDGVLQRAAQIRIMADVIYVDQICATQLVLWESGCVRCVRGTIHGKDIIETHSAFAREVILHQALLTTKEWLLSHTQDHIQYVNIEIGGSLTVYHLQKWLQTGQANFESAAASQILPLINEMGEWLKVDIFVNPLFLPDRHDNGDNISLYKKIFLLLTEHYRQFVLPAQSNTWRHSPPVVPCSSAEMHGHIHQYFLKDERRIIDILGGMDSESASIISYLNLTREVVKEALEQLKGDRSHQVNLLAILSGTRFRMVTPSGMQPTTCPRLGCQLRDSFWHLLTCYSLMDSVECGPFAVPFLVYIARKTATSVPKQPWIRVAKPSAELNENQTETRSMS